MINFVDPLKKTKALLPAFITLLCCLQAHGQRERPQLIIPENTTVHKNLVFSKTHETDLLLDLYLPSSQLPTPLVIWVHGGGWRKGSKNYPRHALELLKKNIAVASINYRLSHEATFPAQIIDCKAAVRWLRANATRYHLKPDKFGAWGSSAGGHLVSLMGTAGNIDEWDRGENLQYSSKIQAVCNWYGPTDFLRMDDHPGNRIHLGPGSPESLLIGKDIRYAPEKVARANPITYITSDDPPFLIMHGKWDSTVIHQQSILLHDALDEKQVKSQLVLIDGAGHGGPDWVKYVDRVITFFEEELSKSK